MKKVLLIRTDRIGDVVLTTPIIKILRHHLPQAKISFMVSSKTQDVVSDHPYLDEIIIYDEHKKHRGLRGILKFSQYLRNKKFDCAIIFNPRRKTHWISALAGIPIRIGYNRKHGFLLTHRFKDRKEEEKKSEAFYNEDLLAALNIKSSHSTELYFPLRPAARQKIDALLASKTIQTPYVVINVSSGCPSKTWPDNNFLNLCHLIYHRLHLHIALIGRQAICDRIKQQAQVPLVSFSETLTLLELGCLFKKAVLHITNDTGPMHIASALGLPVVSIFGRTRLGLGPVRWAPLKGENIVLQKNIGCNPCLAHHCQLDFDCLKATKVEEVFNAIKSITAHTDC